MPGMVFSQQGRLRAASEPRKRSPGMVFRCSEPPNTKTLCFRTRTHKTLARHGVFATGAFTGCLGATKTLAWHGVFATGVLAGCHGGTKTLGKHGVFATGVLTGCLGATKTLDRHGVFATDTLARCLGRTKTLCRHNVFATGALTAASEPLKRSTGVVFSRQELLIALEAWCVGHKGAGCLGPTKTLHRRGVSARFPGRSLFWAASDVLGAT